jgi:hypothetical protein
MIQQTPAPPVRFRSLISMRLLLAYMLLLGVLAAGMAYYRVWPGVVVLLATMLFILHIFLNTEYRIDGNMLHIRSGLVYRKSIAINSIQRITKSDSLISGPATSFNRLELQYGKFDLVYVSPADQHAFANTLKAFNNTIDIRL